MAPVLTPSQLLQQLKVCDFGMTLTDDPRANMTAAVGTLRWMAPEVIRNCREVSYCSLRLNHAMHYILHNKYF